MAGGVIVQQCKACGGVYESMLPDGMEYYHVCPPLSGAALAAAVDAGAVTLTKGQAATLARARAFDKVNPPPLDGVSQEVLELGRLAVSRPNARNENVRRNPATGDVDIVSAGDGTLTLADTGA
jgi:hypothetical protein